MKAFVVDIAKCNGCFNCQIVCKDEHCENDWSPYAKPQPETGQFWIHVTEKVRGQVPWVRLAYTPTLCSHCADAPCAQACPQGAFERRDDGLVVLLPEKCTGCRDCLEACPTGSIFFNEDLNIAQKCTGCAHLLDNGWDVPRCVDACTTGGLQFGEEEDLADVIEECESHPLMETSDVRVYYRNLPKRFIAGSVFDPDAHEVLIGAKVALSGKTCSYEAEKTADELGDFIFQQIEPGEYRLLIEAADHETKMIDVDVTEKDLSVGDVELSPVTR